MAYVKRTSIHGYNTSEPGPAPGIERYEWAKGRSKFSWRRGHTQPAAALSAARSAGIVSAVEVEHTTADTNGKGYGSIDRRYSVTEAGVTEIAVSAKESDEWAAAQSADIWDTED